MARLDAHHTRVHLWGGAEVVFANLRREQRGGGAGQGRSLRGGGWVQAKRRGWATGDVPCGSVMPRNLLDITCLPGVGERL